ncbi:hypothetical protein OAQ47_04655 [Paracoccaceae bacterium]|nr:hypothetical protein [Paracoccaceae bacterium]
MGTIGIILDWSALWLTRDIGLALALGGFGIFAFNSSEIVARMFGTSLISRFGERGIGTSAMLLCCVSMAATTYSQSLAAIVFGFADLGFCSANFIPLVMGLAARRNPENASKIVSDVTTVSFTGFLFGPPFGGFGDGIYFYHRLYVYACGHLRAVPAADAALFFEAEPYSRFTLAAC